MRPTVQEMIVIEKIVCHSSQEVWVLPLPPPPQSPPPCRATESIRVDQEAEGAEGKHGQEPSLTVVPVESNNCGRINRFRIG